MSTKVNAAKVQIKLNAVLSINALNIYSKGVYLPRLGTPSSTEQVQAWIDKISNLLQTILSLNAKQVSTARTTVYNQLCSSCKQIADSPYRIESMQPCEADKDRVVAVRLYKFATEP